MSSFTLAHWCILIAAMLPLACAWLAKAPGMGRPVGQGGFDNAHPREWLARQTGRQARANAAQANSFEGLPFFIGAVVVALQLGAPTAWLNALALAYVLLRVAFIAAYLANRHVLRSTLWLLALAVNVGILFIGW
ncbi:MAG: MAPEG family protein [Pseudomonadota bacterium]|nr:MAPEG family protein [Pseudomonadota bacterium]